MKTQRFFGLVLMLTLLVTLGRAVGASVHDWIWHDGFEDGQELASKYEDVSTNGLSVSDSDAFSGTYSLEQHYEQGQVNAGWLTKVNNDGFPDHVFVRWYHKFEEGFEGFPPKMARIRYRPRSGDWKSVFAVHFWIDDGEIVADVLARNSSQANDAGWLPIARSGFFLDDPENTDRWICFEMEVKLNTPGETDGLYRFWADDELIVERTGVDLRGSTDYKINEIMLDCYWNGGSPKAQSRYYDDFVISTSKIGPVDPVTNATVTDLRIAHAITGSGALTATLRWTAPTDAVTYTMRYSDTLISEDNWASAVAVSVPFTATPGSTEWLTAPIPYTGGTVYFALKSQNAAGDWSALSNSAFWPHWDVYLPLILRGYSGPGVQAASPGAAAVHPNASLSASAATTHSTLINPESDLEYLGAFRLPDEESNGTSWSYGGHGMGYYPGGDPSGPADGHPGSLFGISHPYQNFVSEFSIPAPLVSPDKNVDDLPVATTLQPFADVTAGRQTGGLTGSTLGDIQYYPRQGAQTSDKLYWVMYEYYLPDPEETWHGWCELDFSNLQSQGAWRLDDFPSAATSRYLFDIPETWADAHTPGKYLAAGRYRMVNNGSWGPALYAFGPWNDGNPPPDGSSVDAVQLLKYDSDHTLRDFSHSDDWSDGAWLTAGKKSAVIFAGMKAMRTKASGAEYYGEPGIDGCGYKGYHAEPYYGDILFYDPEILAEVAQETIESYEVQPYATFNVEDYMFMQGCRRTILGGVAYDRQRGLLYVMEKGVEGIYARKPIVHIFRVTDQAQEPDLIAPTVPQNLQADDVTPDQVNFSWDVSSDNVHLVGYIVHRDGVPVATTVITSYSDDKVNPSATYSYTVVAWDARNNRSAPSPPLAVTTLSGPDSRAPIITKVRARDITENSAFISWKTDEPATTYIRYGITYSGDETTIEDPSLATTHQVELTGLTAGADYSYHIASADATGNEHEYPGKSFETPPPGGAANSGPVLNGIGSRRVYEGEPLQFSVSADDKDLDALTYSASDVPPGANFDAGTRQFSWTPGFDDAGTYRVTFTVSDTTQSDSERVTIFVWDNPRLVLQGAPADQAIHLTWTVNTTLPITSTWRLAYDGPTGDQPSPITDIVSPTRAHTLTGLTNYTWYTVTLNAMLASTPLLTDTVRVMPTDIFVYLPLVLKDN